MGFVSILYLCSSATLISFTDEQYSMVTEQNPLATNVLLETVSLSNLDNPTGVFSNTEMSISSRNASTSWDENFGLGIYGSFTDKIEIYEHLYIEFDEAVYVKEVYLKDLYIPEMGYARINSGIYDKIYYTGTEDPLAGGNGDYTVVVDRVVNRIEFSAKIGDYYTGRYNFGVAGIDAYKVPEPNSLWLLLCGIPLILLYRRKIFIK